MNIDKTIKYIRALILQMEMEGCDVEIIMGEYVVDEIMKHLMLQTPRNYKDIKLFGSTVHVDFMNPKALKICKVVHDLTYFIY